MKYTKEQTKSLGFNPRSFYGQVFALIIPMTLQNLINVGITAADVIMLGKVGEKVLSGASLANQVQFIMTLILMGITSGATVLTAQYWGKKDVQTIEKILGMALLFGVGAGVLFAILALSIPQVLMGIFSNDPEVIAEGVKYLRIIGISYVLTSITQVYLYIMRSIERVLIATFVYLASLITNVCINSLLIFGLWGFPKLGIQGAAIGTLAAKIVEMTIVFFYAKLKNKEVKIRFRHMVKLDGWLVKDFIIYALPVVINELLWGMGTSANAAIIGHMGSAATAANSVAQVARQLAMVVVFGVANATAILLGKTIGEKKMELAKVYAKHFVWISVILGVFGGLLILVLGPVATANLALGDLAKEYVKVMFIVMSYFAFCQAINSTLVVGVFRAGGDTKMGLILDLVTMWGFSIIAGALAAFVFKLSVPVVYVLLLSDEVLKLPFTLKRYKSYKWLKDVTREERSQL
ncbi:MATE family efflux transporter [Lachnospiraceae bacterium PAL113]|uniref:MATE family efflux transporter n=2 Tax=Aequitasia blattaphilus TaxID=2949332 RepID=A0ABT1E623_9FIRM|nr:MATE family efflux transporter [Aequitasia blattaphilus]MCP1101280.1 MATE family efflux transporter [Aequitasia blattaphilus]MCR8613920.1 MATE family efflux transporter [Aequitasia blattaphilus]